MPGGKDSGLVHRRGRGGGEGVSGSGREEMGLDEEELFARG